MRVKECPPFVFTYRLKPPPLLAPLLTNHLFSSRQSALEDVAFNATGSEFGSGVTPEAEAETETPRTLLEWERERERE